VIIQGLINIVCIWIAGVVSIIPPMPAEWTNALDGIANGASHLGDVVGNLSPVIPWFTISACISAWLGILLFWFALIVVRAVLWAFGR
jgi:hypothetical protein